MAIRNYSSTAAETTLQSGVNNVSTVILVQSTLGFPAAPFTLALDYGAAIEELVDVTAVAGLSLTVTRAVDGTSATTHGAGAKVRHVSSARDFREANVHVNSSSGVHGLTGSVVGTTDSQTLTNKTLTSPTITGPAITNGSMNGTIAGSPTFSGNVTTGPLDVNSDIGVHVPFVATGADAILIDDPFLTPRFRVQDNGNMILFGQLNLTNASTISWGDVVGGFRYAFKSAATTRASTVTVTADPHLAFAALPVGRYLLDGQLFVDTNTGGGDFRLDVIGGAVGTVSWSSAGGFINQTGPTSSIGEWKMSNHTLATTSTISYMASTNAASPTGILVNGNINVTTAGSLSIAWAQDTSNATGTTLLADSWVRLQRIA